MGNGVLVHDDFIKIPLWVKALQDHEANHAHSPNGLFSTVILLTTHVLAKVGRSQMRVVTVLSWELANTLIPSIPSLLINKYQVTF